MGAFIDLTNKRFGRLLVLKRVPRNKRGAYWKCRCDCGNEIITKSRSLITGQTRSCGCLQKEIAGKLGASFPGTHKMSKSPVYKTWYGMKQRCLNSHDKKYRLYGGRGIRVCPRWRYSFENFFEDMGERPIGLTIDRINPDGNYEPDNCRWATALQQRHNRSTLCLLPTG